MAVANPRMIACVMVGLVALVGWIQEGFTLSGLGMVLAFVAAVAIVLTLVSISPIQPDNARLMGRVFLAAGALVVLAIVAFAYASYLGH